MSGASEVSSLSSIPEEIHGEAADEGVEPFERDIFRWMRSDSVMADEGSVVSVEGSSQSSSCQSQDSDDFVSEGGVDGGDTEDHALSDSLSAGAGSFGYSKPKPGPTGPPVIKIRWTSQTYELDLQDVNSFEELRLHILQMTGVPPGRQTLILGGRRLPRPRMPGDDEERSAEQELTWEEMKSSVKPGQMLMVVGKNERMDESSSPSASSPSKPPAFRQQSPVLQAGEPPSGSGPTEDNFEVGEAAKGDADGQCPEPLTQEECQESIADEDRGSFADEQVQGDSDPSLKCRVGSFDMESVVDEHPPAQAIEGDTGDKPDDVPPPAEPTESSGV